MKLQNNRDAFGQALYAYYTRGINFLLAIRDDGFVSDAGGVKVYFDEYEKWPVREKRALKFIKKTDKVLDIGCGAGRHSLYLQSRGIDVTGIDNSPLAVKVCKLRGLKKAKALGIEDVEKKSGCFDVMLLLCNNFGLLGTEKRAKKLLKKFYKITPPGARIITESYDSNTAFFRDYREFNRKRGRHPGAFRVKLSYGRYETDWFEYIRVSVRELGAVLKDTGWKVSKVFPTKDYSYVAVLEKH